MSMIRIAGVVLASAVFARGVMAQEANEANEGREGKEAHQAAEVRIARSALPAAVERAVAANSAGATIRGFSRETDKGQTVYETEMTVNGHSKDLVVDANGTVMEIEEQVMMASLSPAVQSGLKAKAGRGRIIKIESLTKGGRLVAYEAQVRTGRRYSEIQVGPDGGTLAHEE